MEVFFPHFKFSENRKDDLRAWTDARNRWNVKERVDEGALSSVAVCNV